MHVSPEALYTSGLELTIVFIVTNIIRVFFRPLASEARLIAKFVSKIILYLIDVVKRWSVDEHRAKWDVIKGHINLLHIITRRLVL